MVGSQLPGWLVFGANKENAFYSQRVMRTFLGGWTSGSALTLTSFGMWTSPPGLCSRTLSWLCFLNTGWIPSWSLLGNPQDSSAPASACSRVVPELGFLCHFRSLVCGVQLTDTEYSVRTAAGRNRNTTSQFPSGDLGCWHWRRSPPHESPSSGLASKTRTLDHHHNPRAQIHTPRLCCLLVTRGFSNSRILTPWVGLYSVMSEACVRK